MKNKNKICKFDDGLPNEEAFLDEKPLRGLGPEFAQANAATLVLTTIGVYASLSINIDPICSLS